MSDIRAKVAANLRAIEDMAGRLEQRAIDRATDREHREWMMPADVIGRVKRSALGHAMQVAPTTGEA